MLTYGQISTILDEIRRELEGGVYKLPLKLLRLAETDESVMPFVKGKGGYNYQFFALATRYFKPKNIFELGNLHGVNTAMFYSELAQEAKLTSVDLAKDQRYLPAEAKADPRLRLVYGDCLDLNIYGQDIPNEVDFLFSDTVHFYRQIKDEYDVYSPLLADGALVLIDDINVNDKRRLFDELPFEKWDLTEWCHHNGFGMFRFRRGKSDENPKLKAALSSGRIGFRKYYSLESDINSRIYRRFYNNARQWAARHSKIAGIVRKFLSPLKKNYTPRYKKY